MGFGLGGIRDKAWQTKNFGYIIKGGDDVDKALKKMISGAAEKVVIAATKEACEPIAREIRNAVPGTHPNKPPDKLRDGGTLAKIKASIKVKVVKYPSGAIVGVIGPDVSARAWNNERIDKISIGIELGWRKRTPVMFMEVPLAKAKVTYPANLAKAIKRRLKMMVK